MKVQRGFEIRKHFKPRIILKPDFLEVGFRQPFNNGTNVHDLHTTNKYVCQISTVFKFGTHTFQGNLVFRYFRVSNLLDCLDAGLAIGIRLNVVGGGAGVDVVGGASTLGCG